MDSATKEHESRAVPLLLNDVEVFIPRTCSIGPVTKNDTLLGLVTKADEVGEFSRSRLKSQTCIIPRERALGLADVA